MPNEPFSTNYKPVLQLQTPYTLLPNVSSYLIRYAGWLKHQHQGLYCMFSLAKGIRTFSTYYESDFFNGAR